jgi:hypothetical protein
MPKRQVYFLIINIRLSSTKYIVSFLQLAQPENKNQPDNKTGTNVDWLIDIFKAIFSWAILMPIAVIISGQFLSQPFKLPVDSNQSFGVPIPKILNLKAIGGEAVLGFASFIITLLATALIGGKGAYLMFVNRFGVDPGHFNSLCVLSSFLTVMWTFALWLLTLLVAKAHRQAPDPVTVKRDELINELSKKMKP